MYYVYVYLDTRKKGSYSYGEFHFEYEPFYVGKGKNDRYLTHLKIAKNFRKGKNNLVISKIRSIINDGYDPLILKLKENLSNDDSNNLEIEMIKSIGKNGENGTLVNVANGGDGGITWLGDHHHKGKKLEEIVGEERAKILKNNLSISASKRFSGEGNPMFGKTGDMSPIFGKNHPFYNKHRSDDDKHKISNTLKEYYKNISYEDDIERVYKIKESLNRLTIEELNNRILKRKATISSKSDESKQEWYENISNSLKEKYENGELFSEDHRQKLKNNHYKKLKKGSDELKHSDETKKKISNRLKNRIFTKDHRNKLRKCISFEEFEDIILKLINDGLIVNISRYREYAKDNPSLRYPITPEKSYKNCGWVGWRKYGI